MTGEMLRVPLLGRKPAEIEALLAEAKTVARMEQTLTAFAAYISDRS